MIIKSGATQINVNDEGRISSLYSLKEKYNGFIPFKIAIEGLSDGQFFETSLANARLCDCFDFIGFEQKDNSTALTYKNEDIGLKVTVEISPVKSTGVFVFQTSATNESDKPISLNHLSSFYMSGFGGPMKAIPANHKIHYFESGWQSEARHMQKSIKELGLTFNSTHALSKSFELISIGEYSTLKYEPCLYFYDANENVISFISLECEGSWKIQVGHSSNAFDEQAGFYMESSIADAYSIANRVVLNPGESFVSNKTLFGYVKGDIDEATELLTKARRELYTKKEIPLMFNDYMNCTWCNYDIESTKKMIDVAAEAGCEGYCIDAGWFSPDKNFTDHFGDWDYNRDRFPNGIEEYTKYAKSKGLIAGLWTELEVCSENSNAYKELPDECFIMNNGVRVGGYDRHFFDMRNPKVKEFLFKKVERIYSWGIRYIKNDFNSMLKWSCDAKLIRENHLEAMKFYDSLTKAFPDLLIENCGSGGLRADYGTLKHFYGQSCTDQEIFYFNPAILQGELACLLPEHLLSWSYPYPFLFDIRNDLHENLLRFNSCADGKETVFNMINGIVGNIYLSGRIDYADKFNMDLIKEGCAFYKEFRKFRRNATCIFPNGFTDISNIKDFSTVGFINYEKNTIYIFFWKYPTNESRFIVPLSKWCKNDGKVSLVYPSKTNLISGTFKNNRLVIDADSDYLSGIFKIEF